MNSGDFVIYKIDPNEIELSGEVQHTKNSHGRLFLNSTIEIRDNTIIFRHADKQFIMGIFSSAKYLSCIMKIDKLFQLYGGWLMRDYSVFF
jgi:hypothetical protein